VSVLVDMERNTTRPFIPPSDRVRVLHCYQLDAAKGPDAKMSCILTNIDDVLLHI